MKKEYIGNTPIQKCNDIINQFMGTIGVDYFNEESSLEKVVGYIKELGYKVDTDEGEACISGAELEPYNIPVIADTTKEALFLAVEGFASLKKTKHI